MKTFISVAQMKLAFLTAGQLVETSGYYAAGDGGQARYLVKVNDSVDNVGNHDLAGTTVAILQTLGIISVKQFGAVGDGVTNDTTSFDSAEIASNPAPVFVPVASYKIPGVITGNFYSNGVVTIVTGTVNTIVQSLVDIATQSEIDTGTDPLKYVTPATLKASSNITPFASGSFTGTLTGMDASVQGTFQYELHGKIATIWLEANLTGTSDSTAMTLTGLPAAITPSVSNNVRIGTFEVFDNALIQPANGVVNSSGIITFAMISRVTLERHFTGNFTASGSKGIQEGTLISWPVY